MAPAPGVHRPSQGPACWRTGRCTTGAAASCWTCLERPLPVCPNPLVALRSPRSIYARKLWRALCTGTPTHLQTLSRLFVTHVMFLCWQPTPSSSTTTMRPRSTPWTRCPATRASPSMPVSLRARRPLMGAYKIPVFARSTLWSKRYENNKKTRCPS